MSLLWVDAGRGASGDMLLGALWDAGADARSIRGAVRAVVPADVGFAREVRDGFRVARAVVVPDPTDARDGPGRRWSDIRRALREAPLPDPVRERATAVFESLATTEAAIHGTSPERVHFHEVGGHDSVADVVGTVAALADLGVDRLVSTAVAVGYEPAGGSAAAQPDPPPSSPHGPVPVPAPAVLGLAAAAGAPVVAGPLPGETCTPTGMALLATLADAWGALPPMRIATVGCGAGTRLTPGRFGALRVVLGARHEPAESPDVGVAVVTETNVDDLDPRLWPRVLARLLDTGADDAWLTPVLMKKGRPGHTLSALSAPDSAAAVQDVVLTETSAIGVRVRPVAKHALPRDTVEVTVGGETIRVKRAWLRGELVNAQPEWEDVATAAARTGRPAKEVLARAVSLASDELGAIGSASRDPGSEEET